MKRIGSILLLLVLLSGCTSQNEEMERGLMFRTKLLQGRSCSFEASITADYGDKVYTFVMACLGDEEGSLTFQVIQPESISGISGKIDGDGGELTFQDSALAFELLADGQITPVSAPWILLRALRSGYLTAAGEDGGQLRLTINDSYEDGALLVDVWLDKEDVPVQGEILYEGKRILSLQVKDFLIL